MQVKRSEGRIAVQLSRKNLEDLLFLLNSGAGSGLHRCTEDGTVLSVVGEENDVHYRDRPAGPGADRARQAAGTN